MVANCRPGKAQWWPNVGQVWPNIGQMVAKCGLSEPQFEPEGVDSVQVVSEEAFVADETEVFVQPQRRPVRDFSLQNHLQKTDNQGQTQEFFCLERESKEKGALLSHTQDSSRCAESKEWKKKDSPANSLDSPWPLDLDQGIGKFQNRNLRVK